LILNQESIPKQCSEGAACYGQDVLDRHPIGWSCVNR
jgi:hypothetical protein